MQWTICHCSAGVGRTGTSIALLKLLHLLPQVPHASDLDRCVTETIESMRERRLWMVKTDTEFALLYAALHLRLLNPCDEDFTLSWRAEACPSIENGSTTGREVDNDIDVAKYSRSNVI